MRYNTLRLTRATKERRSNGTTTLLGLTALLGTATFLPARAEEGPQTEPIKTNLTTFVSEPSPMVVPESTPVAFVSETARPAVDTKEAAPVVMDTTDMVQPPVPKDAQDSGAGTGAPGTQKQAGPPKRPGNGPQAGPPPVPVLLNIADFLILANRPFDAEDIYKGILAHNPDNKIAENGLKRAKLYQKPEFKTLIHFYEDTHDATQILYAVGTTFHTRHVDYSLSLSTGYYVNNIDAKNARNPLSFLAGPDDDGKLFRNSINFTVEPHYRKFEGRFFLSQISYTGAPDRTLYDVELAYAPQPPRERYAVEFARRDNILQSGQALFFGPESWLVVRSGLTIDAVGVNVQRPLGRHFDLTGTYNHFDYNDPTLNSVSNERETITSNLYYRIASSIDPHKPVLRAGLGYMYDDTKYPSAAYYAPQKVQSLSLVADYVRIDRGFQYGLFGSYPIAANRGTGFAKHDPPWTLFGFAKYDFTQSTQVFFNLGLFRSPDRAGGLPGRDIDFNDFVLGINTRF